MAIARTSSGSGIGGTSHHFGNNVGDLIVLCLLNTGSSSTLPSTPTGYTSLTSGQDSADGFTMKIVYKFATASNESSTPSNTTSLSWACYSGVDTTTPFTNAGGQSGTTSSISYSGIVSFTNPGNDWVLTFAVANGISGNLGSHPATSMTLPTSGEYKSGSDDNAIFDSNGVLSSYSFNSKTLDAAVPWITKTAELNYASGGGGTQYTSTQAAALSFAGGQAKQITYPVTAALSFAAAQSKAIAHILAAAVPFAANVSRATAYPLSGAASFAGSLPKSTARTLSAVTSFTGSMRRSIVHTLAAALAFSGSLAKRIARAIAATASFAGALATTLINGSHNYTQPLTASVSFIGTSNRGTSRTFSSVLTLLGGDRINYTPNPSFEADTVGNGLAISGWIAYASAGTPTYKGVANDWAEYGTQSFKVSATSNMDGGIYTQITGLHIGTKITLSVWVKSDATVSNASIVLDTSQHGLGGHTTVNANQTSNANSRVSCTLTLDTTGVNVFLGQGSFGSQSNGNVWFDGVLVEQSASANTYFDGNTANARWYGTVNQSVSYMPGGLAYQLNRVLSGSFGFAGGIGRSTAHQLAAVLSFTGRQTKQAKKALAAATYFTGGMGRAATHVLAAAVSFTGSSFVVSNVLVFFAATVGFSGSIARRMTRSLSGTVSLTGSALKQLGRAVSAALDFTGAVAFASVFTMILAGVLSFTGNQGKRATKCLSASAAFSGNVTRGMSHVFAASLGFTGATARTLGRAVGAGVSFSGNIAKELRQSLTASLAFSGTMGKRITRSLVAGASFSGIFLQSLGNVVIFTASLAFSGNIRKTTVRPLAATLGFTGLMGRLISKGMSAGLGFIGSLASLLLHKRSRTAPVSVSMPDNSVFLSGSGDDTSVALREPDTAIHISGSPVDTSITLGEEDDSKSIRL